MRWATFSTVNRWTSTTSSSPHTPQRRARTSHERTSAKLVIIVTFDYVNKIKMSNAENQLDASEVSSFSSSSRCSIAEEKSINSLWIFHKLAPPYHEMLVVPLKFKKVSKLIFYLPFFPPLTLSSRCWLPSFDVSFLEETCPIMDESWN